MLLYKILENPYVHNFVQNVLSIGRKRTIRYVEQSIIEYCKGRVLDIGCGTARYAHLFKNRYIGIDINAKYICAETYKDRQFVCCNAVAMPFKNKAFDSIFSVGFFHHVDFNDVQKIFTEIVRISAPNAVILIIDAFYPNNLFDVFGFILMKLDRGRYARKKEGFLRKMECYFDVLKDYHISGSYPYNVHTFVLKIK